MSSPHHSIEDNSRFIDTNDGENEGVVAGENVENSQSEPKKNCNIINVCLITWAIFLIVVGGLLIAQVFVTSNEINEQMKIKLETKFVMNADKQEKNTSAYQHWVSNTFDDSGVQLFYYYIFNITNHEEVAKGGTPQLSSVGPFTYRRYEEKINPVFSNDSTTVSYTYEFRFEYMAEDSTNETDKDNDYIYVINPALLTFIYYHYCQPSETWLNDLFSALPSSDVFYRTTPQQLLWYIIDENIETGLGFPANSTQYHMINDASFDVTEYTGVGNISRMRELISFYNRTSIDFWHVPEEIEGSRENRQWRYQWLDSDKNLSVYSIEKYRVVDYIYDKEVTDNDLKLYRYKVADSVFYNATNNPTNANYDQFGYNGILNLTNRKSPFRTPAYISKSYFLDADDYVTQVNQKMGLRDPIPSIDDSYFDIEPTTGVVMRNYLSFQLSFQLRPLNLTFSDGNVTLSDLIIPFSNQVVYAYAPNSVLDDLSTQLETVSLYKKLSFYGGPCLALIFFIIAFWFFYKLYKRRNDNNLRNSPLPIPDGEAFDEKDQDTNFKDIFQSKSMTSKFGTPSQNNIDDNYDNNDNNDNNNNHDNDLEKKSSKLSSNQPLLKPISENKKTNDNNYSSV